MDHNKAIKRSKHKSANDKTEVLQTDDDAFKLLKRLGASPMLIQHHRLVVEAAKELLKRGPQELSAGIDKRRVILGASLHDAGKIIHPEEMSGSGKAHENDGSRLLIQNGVALDIARFCDTHSNWNSEGMILEDFIVALADNLWNGKRIAELEYLIIKRVAELTGVEYWTIFMQLDMLFEAVAARGDERLIRSRIADR